MADKLDFIGVGGLAYDLLLKVNQLPLTDDKYPAEIVGRLPGGFIANATCAAAKLGLTTGYVGWVGDDAEGATLYKDFIDWNVQPVGLARVKGRTTPFTIVVTDRTGKRAILLPSFPLYNAELTIEQLSIVGSGRVVYTYPRDAIWCGQLRRASFDGGGLLAMDIEASVPMRGDELRHVAQLADILFVTDNSLKLLGTKSIKDLSSGKHRWVIMTGGEKGAQGITGSMKKPHKQPAFKVTAVDTTGAGDAFHAALIAARLYGAALPEALAFAAAAAAIKVQHRGARGGLPTRAEVERMMI